MTNDLQKELARLKNLRQYRKADPVAIEKVARISLWKKQINIKNRFSRVDDQKRAENNLNAYLENYEISSFDEVQNVADLVYEEDLKLKMQNDIDKIMSDDKNRFVPDKLIASLHTIEERIWKLKDKIGISKQEKKTTELNSLQELEERFKTYIPFNRNEFTLVMPYACSACKKEDVQTILLRRRVKNFDVLKHPALSGRFLYNVEIMNDVRTKLITKEQAARYLKTSHQYIEWVLENEFKIIEIANVPKKDIDNYVNNSPHLRNADEYDNRENNDEK